jgi:hypothetical protein
MVRVTIAIGLAALLAACGGGGTPAAGNAAAGTSADATPGSVAELTGGVQGSNDCSKNPDFAPIYAGGTIKVCSSAHFDATAKTSGSTSYTTPAAPAAVLAWSRDQATRNGLAERMATDKMFSAARAGKLLMVMALPEGSGSRVTVNWTNPD